ncbi:MAG: N-acetyltransferase family protein [Chitinophagales bacterium]
MNIREATINDASSIAKVTVDTWRTAYHNIIDSDYLNNLSYEEREKGWREFPFNSSFIYVAEDDNQSIIGFAAAGPERTSNPIYEGELYAFYIYDEHQRKGIGSALFRSVVQRFVHSGINSLLLWVLTDSPYRRFYERWGGQPIETKPFEFDGLTKQITAYGWPDLGTIL